MQIVEDHFLRNGLSAGDRACNLDATGEDETQHEGVDGAEIETVAALSSLRGLAITTESCSAALFLPQSRGADLKSAYEMPAAKPLARAHLDRKPRRFP